MSAQSDTGGSAQVTAEQLAPVLKKAGLELNESRMNNYSTLLTGFQGAAAMLSDDGPVQPRPDLKKYPRSDIHIPKDTDMGGWATKVTAKCTAPTSNLLAGRTVALKDNIALAGVRCTNGTSMVDWVPEIDATIATRIMDAGGIITGKAACENACMEGVSCTSVTGRVHNPYAEGYNAGGSSSGSGRLVGSGAVDLAIGCDQGGSVRIPASACGIVGLKPTWGLVPYTGILSLDGTIDHAGPMARTVRDCALLLEAIASPGPDGWDDRQPAPELFPLLRERFEGFVRDVDAVTALPKGEMLSGLRVGVLKEGFEIPGHNEHVAAKVRSAVEGLKELGAVVSEVSVPVHTESMVAWMCGIPATAPRAALLGDRSGRKELYLPDRCLGEDLTQEQFDALGPGAAYMHMVYLWARGRFGPKLYARGMNLLKAASDAYDKVLKDVDILVMPTLVGPPTRLPEPGFEKNMVEFIGSLGNLLCNTCPFNNSGHPAISVPVGFSPAEDDPNIKLPVGLQIVARKYRDVDCLKVAAAWEKAFDWKKL